jgi:hypothetical protein
MRQKPDADCFSLAFLTGGFRNYSVLKLTRVQVCASDRNLRLANHMGLFHLDEALFAPP